MHLRKFGKGRTALDTGPLQQDVNDKHVNIKHALIQRFFVLMVSNNQSFPNTSCCGD